MARVLTLHVRERLKQRKISEAQLNYALDHLTGRREAGTPGSIWVYGRAPGGRMLKVCVSSADPDVIITAVWCDA